MSALNLKRVRLNQLRQLLLRRLDLVNRQPELVATKRISIRHRYRSRLPTEQG